MIFTIIEPEDENLFVNAGPGESIDIVGVALFGGNGADLLEGGDGNDLLTGDNGDDALYGFSGEDSLEGGRGDDLLAGGAGNDSLTGGQGSDRFQFAQGDTGADVVTDFALGDGGDVLDIESLLIGDPASAAELDAYLNFSATAVGTEMAIDVEGDASGTDQTIVLADLDLTAAGTLSDEDIIADLLASANLVA